MIERIYNHDRLSAEQQNAGLDAVNALTSPGAAQGAQYGSDGVSFFGPAETRLAIFQLTGALVYPNLTTAATDHLSVEPTPYATARMVWCHQFDPDDKDAGDNPIRSYGGTSLGKTETIYHPAAFRNASGYAIGPASFRNGDRVFCLFNRQSGRWEIMAPAESTWRFQLHNPLSPGGSASAYLLPWTGGTYGPETHVEITVYDAVLGTLRGWGTSTNPAIAGSKGFCKFMADSGCWEILSMQQKAKWIRFQLTQDLSYVSPSASANVLNYWDGVNPLPGGGTASVRNTAISGQYMFSGLTGNIGMGCYDPSLDQYWIVQLECPTS